MQSLLCILCYCFFKIPFQISKPFLVLVLYKNQLWADLPGSYMPSPELSLESVIQWSLFFLQTFILILYCRDLLL